MICSRWQGTVLVSFPGVRKSGMEERRTVVRGRDSMSPESSLKSLIGVVGNWSEAGIAEAIPGPLPATTRWPIAL